MKVMWIGHGGLLFISGKHKVLIDPYLSDSLRLVNRIFKRRIRISHRLFYIKPDVTVITSSHPDRCDIKTVKKLARRRIGYTPTILACESAFRVAGESWGLKRANITMFEKGLEWSLGDMTIKAVDAKTDDRSAFGVIITDNDTCKKYYVASNTLYSEELIASLPTDLYAAFIPISGTFGSMNILDASRFAKELNAQYTVPVQFGTLDKTKAESFICGGRILPKIYKIMDFDSENGVSISSDGIDLFYNEKEKKPPALAEGIELDEASTMTVDMPALEEISSECFSAGVTSLDNTSL
ncbi:MAG: MBL fold metallo-hydrolase [Clostridia bacterium]|nr:MBL fold metallo-hydrolase [Clostridia bacterium]